MFSPSATPPLSFRYAGEGSHLRLEVIWSGQNDPPWYSDSGPRQDLIESILRGVAAVIGVSHVRSSLCSSRCLRVWMKFSDLRDTESIKSDVRAAIEGALPTF